MKALTIALSSIKARPLVSCLSIFSVAAGITLLSALFLLSRTVESGLLRNAAGIDVVVGAKGSPLQLTLSTVYQSDVPTGNIEMSDMKKLSHHPQVKKIIPLALGDNYRGFRIVGTTLDYPSLYNAEMASGEMFSQPFEAVAGIDTGLTLGTAFAGAHGLSADSDDIHHFHDYKITGVLKRTGTVLDRLILTSIGSVQELHRHPDPDDEDAAEDLIVAHQVTALLIQVKNPIAVMNLPREINRESRLLAVNPAYEITRLAGNIGLGRQTLMIIGGSFLLLSLLMLMASMAGSLVMRRYDLGVMRVLGASPAMIATTVMLEAIVLSFSGSIIGLIGGRLLSLILSSFIIALKGVILPASLLRLDCSDLILVAVSLVGGICAALMPAINAARMDIADILAKGRV